MSCPKFKLRWVKDQERRQELKEQLVAECQALSSSVAENSVTLPPNPAVSVPEIDFYEFEDTSVDTYSAEQEVMNFLGFSGFGLETLNNFPNIKKIFLKYNTPTPSSAPVERLFSLGGIVLTPRRNRLSDSRFEMLVLMRFNHHFNCPNPLFQDEN